METSRPPRRALTVRVPFEIVRALRSLQADAELAGGRLPDLGEVVTDLVCDAMDRRHRNLEERDDAR